MHCFVFLEKKRMQAVTLFTVLRSVALYRSCGVVCRFRAMARRIRQKSDALCPLALSSERMTNAQKHIMAVSTYEFAPSFDAEAMVLLVYQREEAPLCGKHFQIYCEFKRRVTAMTAAKALGFPVTKKGESTGENAEGKANRVSVVGRFGPADRAIRYCTSSWYCRRCHAGDSEHCPSACLEGCDQAVDKHRISDPVVVGEILKNLDFGAKLNNVIDMVKRGASLSMVIDEDVKFAKNNLKFIQLMMSMHAPKRHWQPVVVWLAGPAGSDKSRLAKAVCTDVYMKPPDSRWFDGYDGQRVLVMNDLRKSTLTFSYLLDLLDRYELQVEVKCGYRQMTAEMIIITCAKSHASLWQEIAGHANENLHQLSRRVSKEVMFPLDLKEKRGLLKSLRSMLAAKHLETIGQGGDALFGEWNGVGAVPNSGDTTTDDDLEPAMLPLLDALPTGQLPHSLECGCGNPNSPSPMFHHPSYDTFEAVAMSIAERWDYDLHGDFEGTADAQPVRL